MRAYTLTVSGSTILSGSLDSMSPVTASFFKGDGSAITGVTAEWDGTHTGNGNITGTLTFGSLTDGTITIADFKDEDDMSSNSATSLSTQQSIKAYVDSQIATEDTLAELNDTNITTPADASLLFYDTGTSTWRDGAMSGDATIGDTGAITLSATNTNLTTLANVTTVGTIGTGIWQGSDVGIAYGGTGASTVAAARTAIFGATDLAVVDGGTGASSAGTARTNLGVDVAGTDNSTDVTLAGTPDYITISGQAITRNIIDIGDDTNLVAGTGITLTDDTLSIDAAQTQITSLGTIGTGTWEGTAINQTYLVGTSGTNTGDQSIFQTITVSGQDNVVADSTTDTLTLVASTGVTIANTAASDTIAFSIGQSVATNANVTFTQVTGSLLGNVVGNVTGDVTGDVTGNADTATILAAARTIGGVSFNGSANINLPGVNASGNQDTSGNAATVTTNANLTGIVTSVGNATSIADGEIGYAKLSLEDEIQASDIPDGLLGLVKLSSGGTASSSTYLRGDNTWATLGNAATATVADSTANTNFPIVFNNESNGLLDDTGALRYNPSTGTLLAPNLVVAGTSTLVNTVTMEASNAVIFEGATADDYETTLSIVDPTADRTVNLPNLSGYLPVLAVASTTAISSTPAELNLLDGSIANTVVNSKAVVYGSGGEVTVTNVTGSLSGNVTGALTGNATTATTLATARTIGGTSFDGSANIAVALAATATTLATARAINGVDFDGSAAITVTAAAGTLSGTTLKSTVVTSSLTSVGTLTSLTGGTGDFNWDSNTLVVDSSESRVGIGTASPARTLHVVDDSDARLYIENTAVDSQAILGLTNDARTWTTRINTDDTFRIRDTAGTGERDRLVIDTSGNVGIGTASPGANLHIAGTGGDGTELLRLYGTASDTFNWASSALWANLAANENVIHLIGRAESTKNSGYIGYLYSSAGSNANVLTFGHHGSNNLMNLTGDGKLGIGTSSPSTDLHLKGSGNVGMRVESTSTGARDYDIYTDGNEIYVEGVGGSSGAFLTGENGTFGFKVDLGAPANSFFLNGSGNLGIGATSPYTKLEVETTVSDAYTPTNFNDKSILGLVSPNADTNYSGIRFTNSADNYEKFFGSVQTSSNTADMVFQGYDRAADAYKEYLRIKEDGNVGIGTTTPLTELDVNGRFRSIIAGTDPSSGTGLEMYYDTSSTEGRIYAYDRSGSAWKNLKFGNAALIIYANNSATFASDVKITSQLQFASNNNVRIYTSETYNRNLEFSMYDSTPQAYRTVLFLDGATAGSGRVGIGTTSPGGRLDVGTGHMVNEQGRQDHVSNTMPQPYYRFDGVDDYILTSSVGANSKAVSVSVNFMLETLQSGFATIIQVGDLLITKKETSHVIHINQAGQGGVDSVTALVAEKWYHMVVTIDGSNTKLYLNGVLDATLSATAFTTGVIYFGKYSSGQFSNCQISDSKVYNIALTATEVKELYSGASVPFKYKGANQTELLTNGGLESWNSSSSLGNSWGTYSAGGSSINRDSDDEDSGTYCARFDVSSSDGNILIYQSIFERGRSYRVSFRAKGSAAFNARVQEGDGAVSLDPSGLGVNFTVSTSYQTFTYDFTAAGKTSGLSTLTIGRVLSGGAASNSLFIDTVSVTRIGAVAEYDGGSAIDTTWYDKSGNNFDGTVSGSSIQNRIDALEVVGVLKTGDLELENERGHWKIIEESEYLSIYNVNTNKKYKLLMEEIE